MSLIAFHKFLIVTAILFALGLAVRQLFDFRDTGNSWALIAALGFAGVGLAFAVYLRHLRQILKMPDPQPFLPSQIDILDESEQ
jgi:hypothetical protein